MTNKKTKKRESVKTNKKKLPPLVKYICITLGLLSLIFLTVIGILNVLPLDYFITLTCLIVVVVGVLIYLVLKKRTRIVGTIISFLLIIVYVIGIVYSVTTLGFLDKVTKGQSVLNYEIVVLKDSEYKEINDLKNKTIGVVESIPDKSLEELEKTIKYNTEKEFSTEDLASSLLNEEVDALMILESENDLLEEHYPNYETNTKTIYKFSIKVKDDVTAKNIDVTESSFNILVSGIDTYGAIGSLSRSDVNMVVIAC